MAEAEKRKIYVKAFGCEFDNKARKQLPLPLDVAYRVALHVLTKSRKIDNKKGSVK